MLTVIEQEWASNCGSYSLVFNSHILRARPQVQGEGLMSSFGRDAVRRAAIFSSMSCLAKAESAPFHCLPNVISPKVRNFAK